MSYIAQSNNVSNGADIAQNNETQTQWNTSNTINDREEEDRLIRNNPILQKLLSREYIPSTPFKNDVQQLAVQISDMLKRPQDSKILAKVLAQSVQDPVHMRLIEDAVKMVQENELQKFQGYKSNDPYWQNNSEFATFTNTQNNRGTAESWAQWQNFQSNLFDNLPGSNKQSTQITNAQIDAVANMLVQSANETLDKNSSLFGDKLSDIKKGVAQAVPTALRALRDGKPDDATAALKQLTAGLSPEQSQTLMQAVMGSTVTQINTFKNKTSDKPIQNNNDLLIDVLKRLQNGDADGALNTMTQKFADGSMTDEQKQEFLLTLLSVVNKNSEQKNTFSLDDKRQDVVTATPETMTTDQRKFYDNLLPLFMQGSDNIAKTLL